MRRCLRRPGARTTRCLRRGRAVLAQLSAAPWLTTGHAPHSCLEAAEVYTTPRAMDVLWRLPVADVSRDLPAYRDLPIDASLPPGSAWGVFGNDDQVETINLLTA